MRRRRSGRRGFGRVEICLLLRFRDILLIAYTLVAKPVGHLCDAKTTASVSVPLSVRAIYDVVTRISAVGYVNDDVHMANTFTVTSPVTLRHFYMCASQNKILKELPTYCSKSITINKLQEQGKLWTKPYLN